MKRSINHVIFFIAFALAVWSLTACNSTQTPEPVDNFSQPNALGEQPIWSFETEENILSTPVLDDNNRVYIRTTGSVVALDTQSGAPIWKATSPGNAPLGEAPRITGNVLIVPEKESRIAAFNSDTGELLWRSMPIDSGLTHPSALEIQSVATGKTMAYTARFNYGLTAYRITDGQIVWEQEYSSRSNPHLAINEEALYLGMGSSIKAYDTLTGNALWEKELDGYIGPMLVVDHILYVVDEEHTNLYAIDVDNQQVLWTKSYPQKDNYEFDCLSVIDNRLLIAGRELTTVSKSNGQILWTTGDLGRLECPATAKGKVYIRNIDDTLYVIDLDTGKEIGKVKISSNTNMKHQPDRSPIASDELIIVPVSNNKIVAYRP